MLINLDLGGKPSAGFPASGRTVMNPKNMMRAQCYQHKQNGTPLIINYLLSNDIYRNKRRYQDFGYNKISKFLPNKGDIIQGKDLLF